MTFEWLVALRYLRSPNRPAVLRIVTLLAVVGVAAGVTTLVIALSMNTGFRQAIRDRLLSVTAHVNLKPIGTQGIRNYQQLSARLADTPGVRSIEPAIYATVLLSSGPSLRVPLTDIIAPLDFNAGAGSAIQQVEREMILRALRESNWVVGGVRGAAARLRLNRTGLAYKMKKFGISRPTQQHDVPPARASG